MRVLALETSWRTGSVAALEDDRLLGQIRFDARQRSARSFAPALREQLAAVGWRPADVQLVAVSEGPGSFTGLRIGVTAAKTFAYATGAHVIGVHTLKAIAAQVPAEIEQVEVVADAQRGELFAAAFQRIGPRWRALGPTRVVPCEHWLPSLRPAALLTGPALELLRDRLPADAAVADRERWNPQAATVGRLGYLDYAAGKRDDLWKLVPQYYRKSAAEEKLEARQATR